MFERYDEHARRAIFYARYEASQTGSQTIEAMHILLGLLRERGALFALANPKLSVTTLMEACRRTIPAGEKIPTSVDLPLSEECKDALAEATNQADEMHGGDIQPIHLALGLVRSSSQVAAVLKLHDITEDNLKSPNERPVNPSRALENQQALVEFVCEGEFVATTTLNLVNPLPRTGDEVHIFRHHNKTYKVLRLQHHFEGPSASRSVAHCWLVKVVIEVEAIDAPEPPELVDYT